MHSRVGAVIFATGAFIPDPRVTSPMVGARETDRVSRTGPTGITGDPTKLSKFPIESPVADVSCGASLTPADTDEARPFLAFTGVCLRGGLCLALRHTVCGVCGISPSVDFIDKTGTFRGRGPSFQQGLAVHVGCFTFGLSDPEEGVTKRDHCRGGRGRTQGHIGAF